MKVIHFNITKDNRIAVQNFDILLETAKKMPNERKIINTSMPDAKQTTDLEKTQKNNEDFVKSQNTSFGDAKRNSGGVPTKEISSRNNEINLKSVEGRKVNNSRTICKNLHAKGKLNEKHSERKTGKECKCIMCSMYAVCNIGFM